MKITQFSEFGRCDKVIDVVETEDFAPPAGKSVTVRMLTMSINPSDILTIEGDYGVRPPLPFTPGGEGVGRVEAVGEGVQTLKTGDLVLPLAGSCWREFIQCGENAVIPIPQAIDLEQAAMIKANPATAEVMLTTLVDLKPGDWFIQNASNSAVGRFVTRLAKIKGLNCIAIVRRPEVVDLLEQDGAACVLVANDQTSNDDIVTKVKAAIGDNTLRLGLDAIGGGASNLLAACLTDGGKVVNYGLLSGEPCQLDPYHLVFRHITLTGFWLTDWFAQASRDDMAKLYGMLIPLIADGTLSGAIEARYPLTEIKAAVAHAAKGMRSGKVLLTAPDAA